MSDNERTNLIDSESAVAKCFPMQKICYGLGHIYNDLCAAVWFSYALFYFQIVLQMEPTMAGTMLMIGQVADSIATPITGWAIDKVGYLRIWNLFGTALVATGFSLIFSINPGVTNSWHLVFYGIIVIIFQIGWAIVQISHLSIITSISENNKESAELTTIRYIATVCSNIFVYFITWAVLQNVQNMIDIGPNDYYKFKEIALIITALGVMCSLIYYCGINKLHEKKKNNSIEDKVEVSSETSKSFWKSAVTYQVSLMYMASRLYTILNLIYMPLYLNEDLKKEDSESSIREVVATVPFACFVSSLVSSIILQNRPNILSDRIVYALGGCMALVGCICFEVKISGGVLQYYGLAFIIGIAGSATMIASLCITAEFVTTNGYKGGSVYSTVTFTDKLISGTVVFIIQNIKCEDLNNCPNFYRDVLALVTGFISLLGLMSLLFLPKLQT